MNPAKSKYAARLSAVLTILALACFVGCSGKSDAAEIDQVPSEFSRDYALAANKLIYVDNNNGTTRIVGGETPGVQDGMVRVEAVLENSENMVFHVTEDESQLTVTATSPKGGGLLGLVGQSYTSEAEIVIYIPGGANPVEVRTDNGSVQIDDTHGGAIVALRNGGARVDQATGDFDLSVGNGIVVADGSSGVFNVAIDNGRIDFTGSFDEGSSNSFTTNNGNIDLNIGGELSLAIDAEISSSDSEINSSFALDTVTEDSDLALKGSVGPASSSLLIRVDGNGSINLGQSESP